MIKKGANKLERNYIIQLCQCQMELKKVGKDALAFISVMLYDVPYKIDKGEKN